MPEVIAKNEKNFTLGEEMTSDRDPFRNPFPADDPDRRAIWEMLVPRDIDAFVSADWRAVQDDFIEVNFWGMNAQFQSEPEAYRLSFPTLAAYRAEWLRQAEAFGAERDSGAFAADPRQGIYAATRLEQIEIDGETALVRKKFDGRLERSDGSHARMNWQTLYICRRSDGRWKIAGFVGYLPHIRD